MTPEELKEIEERFSKASPFLIGINGKIFFNLIGQKDLSEDEINFILRSWDYVKDLLEYIKELEYEIDMLSASPDETSSHCGTFLKEREGLG